MNHLISSLAHHGYILVFAVVLAEAIGLPVPAALALVAGGAGAAAGTLSLTAVLTIALLAMMLGDCLLYVMGRQMGWGLLGLLCGLSATPETCILRSAESFYKRGKITLVLAKFVPGMNSMAPPLAGSMKMLPWQFLRLDLAGAALYVTSYIMLGFVFRNFLGAITRGFQAASHTFTAIFLVAVAGYIVYRIGLYRKHKIYRVVPRVQVEELAHKLAAAGKGTVVVLDVRSHGYYDAGALRIEGSLRFEPNNLTKELTALPKDKDIYVYCT